MPKTTPAAPNLLFRRALIIKIGAIGDAVMAAPLARELRTRGVTEVNWLCGADVAPIVGLINEVSNVISLDQNALFGGKRFAALKEVLLAWWRMRKLKIDKIFLLHSDKRYELLALPWSHLITKVRVGGRRHHTFDYARLAYPEFADNELEFAPYSLPRTQESEPRVCIFPGGAKNSLRDNPLRRWPIQNYVSLSRKLIQAGYRVSVLGGPSDSWTEPYFDELRPKLDWKIGKLKLPETVEFLRISKLAVSHDTGPIHLSSLADCKVVTLFGPTNSEWFAPLKFKDLVLESSPKLPCQPCYDGKEFGKCENNLCMQTISVDQVFATIQEAWSHEHA